MRVWIGGPRILGLRTGISFGPEDLRRRQRASLTVPMTHVYVITGDHGRTKIGISTNPAARLSQLQTSSPYPLRIAAVATYDRARDVEAEAHALLSQHRVSGEWFACTPELAIAAVTSGAAHIGARLAAAEAKPWKRPWWHAVMRWIGYTVIALSSAAFTLFMYLLYKFY